MRLSMQLSTKSTVGILRGGKAHAEIGRISDDFRQPLRCPDHAIVQIAAWSGEKRHDAGAIMQCNAAMDMGHQRGREADRVKS